MTFKIKVTAIKGRLWPSEVGLVNNESVEKEREVNVGIAQLNLGGGCLN